MKTHLRIDRFHYFYQEKQDRLRRFMSNENRELMVMQHIAGEQYEAKSHTKEETFEEQMRCFDLNLQLESDLSYYYLEPWHGCGVYAAAFSAKVIEYPHTAIQTLCCYDHVEQVQNLSMPNYKDCEVLMRVLDTIRYFREQTGDEIPIALTDMQSPNDTASLVLEPCELFAVSITEPELIQPFLSLITQFQSHFIDVQTDAIGSAKVARAGHSHPSDPELSGISVSDDNMSFLSPESYRQSSKTYNAELASRFNGMAMHSCGAVAHNLADMLEIEGLHTFDCALGYGDPGFMCDPNPNDAIALRTHFLDRNIALKVRLGPSEVERVYPLLTPRIKLIVELITHGTVEERNGQYFTAKEKMLKNYNRGD